MSTERRKRSILRLFAGYPAMMTDKTQISAMVSIYLETLAMFPEPIIAAACEQARRSDSPFPPSAGQVYRICGALNARCIADERAALPKSTEPKSTDQRPEEPRITQDRWDDLKLTIAEAALGSRFPQ